MASPSSQPNIEDYSVCKRPENEEQILRRKVSLERFSRLNLNETRRRYQPLVEAPQEDTIWKTDIAQSRHRREQLAYTIPYQAEYQMSHDDGQIDNQDVSTDQSSNDCSASTISGADTVTSLPSIRGRRLRMNINSLKESMNDFERTSTILPPSEIQSDDYTSTIDMNLIRKKFFTNYEANKDLPIYTHRNYIINSINSYSVVIIEGATGCGKTTQVPSYILEDAIIDKSQNEAPLIYVTQPRRIAAKSIAKRVCDEHGWELGSIVGYQVGLDKKVSSETILTFCTSGVLLQKLIQEKTLKNFTHIVIDEAHERDADTDLLLMMIRNLMRKEMTFFRLIVMSATLEVNKMKSYFTFRTNYGHRGMTTPALVKVGQPIALCASKAMYLDRMRYVFKLGRKFPTFDIENPELYEECLEAAVETILNVIPKLETFNESTKSTLVFLPGLAEICKLDKMLRGSNGIELLPLHSCISASDQLKVFNRSEPGYRKVILATNIAESSITVPDVGFIVDFCLTKTLMKDPITRFPTLKLQWCTVDRCTQRAGRTGRCCPGKVIRLVPSQFFNLFQDFATPELLTAPLELSVLRVKNFQIGESIKALFAVVMDPPPLNDIRSAVLELKQIGALSSTMDGKLSDLDGDLTELGKVISALPIDVHLSKLIVLASVLDVVEDAIIVAACLSTNRTVVKHLYGGLLESYNSKLNWANGSYSDLFVSLDVYKEFAYNRDELKKDDTWLARYCYNRNLDDRKLHEVAALINELKTRLEALNITALEQPNRVRNRHEDELMLKIAFCASFYPNYFVTEDMDTQEVKKSLCGLDPTKTVILNNLPINQVPLYRTQILSFFEDRISNDIDYIADCSKTLLVFNDNHKMCKDESTQNSLGEVLPKTKEIERAVYLALKLYDCSRLHVCEYVSEAAIQRMSYYNNYREIIKENLVGRLLPPWSKITEPGCADNSRLFETLPEEYAEITSKEFYVEIDIDEKQDNEDFNELSRILNIVDKHELAQKLSDVASSMHEGINDERVFKNEWKQIRGPFSPIMRTFRSVLQKSRGYSVDIDPFSLNSIILDPDYEVNRRQLLVAASVCQTKRSRIMARDTTLMPKVRGLSALMSLLFAQYYKVIYNTALKCISGAIFGIGWDENDRPIDENYEVHLNFDVQISKNDIDVINKARQYISELIRFIEINNPGKPKAELQKKLREIILLLIKKKRFPIQESNISIDDCNNGECGFVADKHNIPENQLEKLNDGQSRVFLPLMIVTKNFSDNDLFVAIRENLSQMDRIERCLEKPPINGIRCLLCGSGQGSLLLMQSRIVNHVNSESHIEKLREFEIFEERCRSLD